MKDYGKWDRRFTALAQRSIFLIIFTVAGFVLTIGGAAFSAEGYAEVNVIKLTCGILVTAMGFFAVLFTLVLAEAQKRPRV